MRIAVIALCFAAAAAGACGPRQVEVRTAPAQNAQVAVEVTNNLSQPVNVYVVSGGTDTFLRQVPANTVATLPVQAIAPGTSVTVKAVTIDGTHTYTRDNVVLTGTYRFPLP